MTNTVILVTLMERMKHSFTIFRNEIDKTKILKTKIRHMPYLEKTLHNFKVFRNKIDKNETLEIKLHEMHIS